MSEKLPYPVVAIKANDWAGYPEEFSIDALEEISPLQGWVVGLLLNETAEFITIGHEYFPEIQKCRWVTCINKVTILQRIDFEIEGRET